MRKDGKTHNLRVGKLFEIIANAGSLLGWCGIPLSVCLAYFRKSWLLVVPGILILILVLFLRYCRNNHRKIISWIMTLFAPNAPYRLLAWDAVYEYRSMTEMCFRVEYEVKAMQTGVDHIRVRFNWSGESGSDPIEPRALQGPGFQSERLEDDGREYGYRYYKLFNHTPHNRTDSPFKMGVEIPSMKADVQKLSHHLLVSVSMLTEQLSMRVVFPENIIPEDIEFFEYIHATDDYHWNTKTLQPQRLNGKWVIEKTIPEPIYGGKYKIQWTPKVIQ